MFVSAPHFCLAGHPLFNHLALLTGHRALFGNWHWRHGQLPPLVQADLFSRSVSTSLLWQWWVVLRIAQTLSQMEGKVLLGENFPTDPNDKQKYWQVHQRVYFGPLLFFHIFSWLSKVQQKQLVRKLSLSNVCSILPSDDNRNCLYWNEWKNVDSMIWHLKILI